MIHPGQLSLAIPPWVGVVSTSKFGNKQVRYTMRCTIAPYPWSHSIAGVWLRTKDKVSPHWPMWLEKDYSFFLTDNCTGVGNDVKAAVD